MITLLGLFLSECFCLADENNLFAYDNSYLKGRYIYIIDSLGSNSNSAKLVKARTLAALGEYQDAFDILNTLGSNTIEAAVIYYRFGEYAKARQLADRFAAKSGISGEIANYILILTSTELDSSLIANANLLAKSKIRLFRSTAFLKLADYYYNCGLFDSASVNLQKINLSYLSPLQQPDYYFLQGRLFYHTGDYNKALNHFKDLFSSNYIFDRAGQVTNFAIDSLSERLDAAQKLVLVDVLRRRLYYDEALALLDSIEKSDSTLLITAWCYFGNKQYSEGSKLFNNLRGSTDSAIALEATYAKAACDYRLGNRLGGVDKLLAFVEKNPNHPLAPKALFTAGDFYQQSDLPKSASLFKKLADNYPDSRFYSRAIFLQGKSYLAQGLPDRARELFAGYKLTDDFADMFDFWHFKIFPADSSRLHRIIERDNLSFYNFRARQALGIDKPDSLTDFADFIKRFFDRAEQFLNWKVPKAPFDNIQVAYTDSLFKYGLEYEAGRHLLAIRSGKRNLYQDLAVLRKAYYLNLDWAFFSILKDFKASLQSRGFPFSQDTWERLNYPVLFENIIKYHSRNNIDPYLALAVIKRESRFDPLAVSNVGAMGLMQLMMPTAVQMGATKKMPTELLFEPGYNIKLGCKYLHWLEAKLSRKEIVAAAYNAGPAAAKKWKRLANGDVEAYIEEIGYDQSRNYARWVVGDFSWYKSLWPDHFGN